MTLTTPGGSPASATISANSRARQAGVGGRLEHHRVAHGDRRGDLPGQHQQREIPRDDLPDHAHRLVIAQLGFHQLRPAGVIVEVARQQRHVDIARLADRLAVVHRFEHGQQAVVLLDVAGDGVQVAGAHHARGLAPGLEGRARGGDACIHLFCPAWTVSASSSPLDGSIAGDSIAAPLGVTHSLLMNRPNLRPCSSSQALTASGDSGAGPYSMVLKTSSKVLIVSLQV